MTAFRAQLDQPEGAVKILVGICELSILSRFVFMQQPPAHPHRTVGLYRPISIACGTDTEVIGPPGQHSVDVGH